jgi:hypothetical protein
MTIADGNRELKVIPLRVGHRFAEEVFHFQPQATERGKVAFKESD